jgi:hypothetical protein
MYEKYITGEIDYFQHFWKCVIWERYFGSAILGVPFWVRHFGIAIFWSAILGAPFWERP